MSLTKRVLIGVWMLALALVALPQLLYPFGFDQAVYSACGDVIRRGGVPIRDCFETKQPGVMVMFAIPALITRAPIAIHAFTLLWQAGTALLLARFAWSVWGSRMAALAAGSLYWLMYAGVNYWSMDQAETFSGVLLAGALWALIRNTSTGSRRDAFVAGLLIGLAMWFKVVFALVGIAMGAVWLIYVARLHWGLRPPLIFGLHYALGVLAVVATGLALYALVPNGLAALVEQFAFLRENFPLAEPLPASGIAQQLLRFLDNGADVSGGHKATLGAALAAANVFGGGFPIVTAMAAIGLAGHLVMRLATLRTRAPNDLRGASFSASALLFYIIAALGIVAWQGNYIQYHYGLLHAPLALAAGSAIALPARLRRLMLAAGVAACALLVWRMTPLLADAVQNALIEGKPIAQIHRESRQGVLIDVADVIRAATGPDDSISIIGDAPWLYTLSDRRNATRHAFVNVWTKKPQNPSHAAFTAQWLEGLKTNRPKLILLAKDNYPWQNNSTIDDYKANTALSGYVDAHYRYIGEAGPMLLFERSAP